MDKKTSFRSCAGIRKYIRTNQCYNPNKLKNIRIAQNLTRREVITKTNMSYSTLEKLENGRISSPEWTTMYTLAELYGCCIGEFCDQNLEYIHCTKLEKHFFETIKINNINLQQFINLLEDHSPKGNLIRQLFFSVDDFHYIPEEIIIDIIKMNNSLFKHFKKGIG